MTPAGVDPKMPSIHSKTIPNDPHCGSHKEGDIG